MDTFDRLNEKGKIERLDRGPRYSFHYWNQFYGECTFTARVAKDPALGLRLESESMQLDQYQLQRGNRKGIVKSAEAFFQWALHRYMDPAEIDPPEVAVQPGWSRIQQVLLAFRD